MPSRPNLLTVAGSAVAFVSLGNVSVLIGVRMPLRTVSSRGSGCRNGLAPKHVDLPRHRLQVGRPDTGAIPAEMVEFKAIRDESNEVLVRPPMGSDLSARAVLKATDAKQSVAVVGGSRPCPASVCLLDQRPETRFDVGDRPRQKLTVNGVASHGSHYTTYLHNGFYPLLAVPVVFGWLDYQALRRWWA